MNLSFFSLNPCVNFFQCLSNSVFWSFGFICSTTWCKEVLSIFAGGLECFKDFIITLSDFLKHIGDCKNITSFKWLLPQIYIKLV